MEKNTDSEIGLLGSNTSSASYEPGDHGLTDRWDSAVSHQLGQTHVPASDQSLV